MSLVVTEEFQHILRVLNTNIDGTQKVPFALTKIRGIGRRFAFLICKKAEIDVNMRAGQLTEKQIEKVVEIIQNPNEFKMPLWMLNRQKDYTTGRYTQLYSNVYDAQLRLDLARLRKIRCHRGLRHFWGLRVRGQHTKTTGRKGRTVGVSKRKADHKKS
eukprot:TRINITY_DN280_c0_g1_i1.p1 TRINITY_DN280_c0_g1~~TRINITY_DN280_c0_g1_i1.p1  ORF type:complete len:159 (-),score=22.88 TRINITY_DN280_c0_g1_i1:65-541(-)